MLSLGHGAGNVFGEDRSSTPAHFAWMVWGRPSFKLAGVASLNACFPSPFRSFRKSLAGTDASSLSPS